MSERIDALLYLIKKLDKTEDEIEYIKTAVKYFFTVEGKVNYGLLVKKSKEIIPERRDEIMTIAEQLRKEGLEKGKIEGKIEGKREGIKEVICMQLNIKFGRVSDKYKNKLEEIDDEQKLESIAEKILVVDNIEELEEWFN